MVFPGIMSKQGCADCISDVSRLEPIIISQLAPNRIERAQANEHAANTLGKHCVTCARHVTTRVMSKSAVSHVLFTMTPAKFKKPIL